jgi:hypothetical protein
MTINEKQKACDQLTRMFWQYVMLLVGHHISHNSRSVPRRGGCPPFHPGKENQLSWPSPSQMFSHFLKYLLRYLKPRECSVCKQTSFSDFTLTYFCKRVIHFLNNLFLQFNTEITKIMNNENKTHAKMLISFQQLLIFYGITSTTRGLCWQFD